MKKLIVSENNHVSELAEAIRTTVVPIGFLSARLSCRYSRADKDSYRHDRRADKNPYRHDRNMRFSSKLNYALFSILNYVL